MVEQSPLISVIIPYFNKVTTIERSVDSVINQTHTNWEIIIVDDCSKIKLEKLAKWENYNITILYNQTNLGPGPSRQRALDMSKGEYVAFLDADDWWECDFFRISLENHSSDIAATWVQSNVILNNFENQIRRYNEIGFTDIPTTIIQFGHPWQTGSLLWQKKTCGKWGELSTNQDSYFEISTSLNCRKVKPIAKVLFNHDETGLDHRSKYVTTNKSYMNNFELYQYIYECYRDKINFHFKVVLFHRLSRCMLKIIENCEDNQIKLYQNKLNNLYFITLFFGKSIRIYKLIHYSLQQTKYKLYF